MAKTGRGSRDKGSSAERWIANYLQNHFPELEISRNLNQTRDGGYDILGMKPFAIEVKRAEKLHLTRWWAQVCDAAEAVKGDAVPVLIYRGNRQPWRVRLPLVPFATGDAVRNLDYIPEVSLELFVLCAREYLQRAGALSTEVGESDGA